MVFDETITIECFLAVWPLPPMVFQWFLILLPSLSMVFDGSGPLVKRCDGFDGSLWSTMKTTSKTVHDTRVRLKNTQLCLWQEYVMKTTLEMVQNAGNTSDSLEVTHPCLTNEVFPADVFHRIPICIPIRIQIHRICPTNESCPTDVNIVIFIFLQHCCLPWVLSCVRKLCQQTSRLYIWHMIWMERKIAPKELSTKKVSPKSASTVASPLSRSASELTLVLICWLLAVFKSPDNKTQFLPYKMDG